MNPVRKARMIAGLKQGELAEKLGVSTVAVSSWENGKSRPNVKRLKQVAKVLHTTVEKLLEEERAM